MSDSIRKYLVIGPSWVGDMVMAQSLFITLKQLYPDCDIDVVAPEWSLPVLERMPEVRQGIGLPVKHGQLGLFTRYRLGRSLREQKYTHAIVLPRSWKAALVPFVARVPVRTGYRGEMRYGLINDMRSLDKFLLTQTVQRFVAHAYDAENDAVPEVPHPALLTDQKKTDLLLDKLGLSLNRPVIGIMPGAEYGPAKQWPIHYYADLALRLVGHGYQVWVFGSGKEYQLGEEIVESISDYGHNLCGKTQLVEAVDLMACVDQVVTNDSGLMHIACAVGVKVNAVYGSSTPDYTPPLINDEKLNIFYLGLTCSPCFKRTCPLGHTNCLVQIKPEDVYSKIVL